MRKIIDPEIRKIIGEDHIDPYIENLEICETRTTQEREFDNYVISQIQKGKKAKVAIRKAEKKKGTETLGRFNSDFDKIEYFKNLNNFNLLESNTNKIIELKNHIKESEKKIESGFLPDNN